MNLRVPLFCVLFSLVCLTETVAQQYNFQSYSVQDGLPQSSVFSMLQDSRGYLWLGTLGGGVSRFDGESFEVFDMGTGLAGNMIRCIFEDDGGNLWFGSEQGLSLYDGFRFYTISEADGLLGDQVLSIFQSAGGNIWVGTNMGLNRLSPGKDTVLIKNFGSSEGLGTELVFGIQEDDKGRIWVATYHSGLLVLEFDGDQISFMERLDLPLLPSNTILDIEKDPEGHFWIGTSNAGVCLIHEPGKGKPYKTEFFGRQQGLRDITVYDIEIDHSGNIWVSTVTGGLHCIVQGEVKYYGEPEGAPSSQILCVMEDRDNKIWAGSNDKGFFRLMGDYFIHFTEASGLPHNAVSGIVEDRQGNLWVATFGGGLSKIERKAGQTKTISYGLSSGLPDLRLNALSLAPDGNLWIATNDHGIVEFDGKRFRNLTVNNGLVDNHVNSILADSQGDVWCGTNTGLCRFKGKGFFCLSEEDEFGLINNTITSIIEDREGNVWVGTWGGLIKFAGDLMTDYDEAEGLTFKRINTLCEGPDGRIWIGTFGGGLFVFDPAGKGGQPISKMADNILLSSNNLFSLVFLNDSTLLAGTDRGFDRITLNGENGIVKVRNYDRSDGFTGMENMDNAIYHDTEGVIWFGTVNGLTAYVPSGEEPSLSVPVTGITGVKLLYQDVNWEERGKKVYPWFPVPQKLELPFSDNHLTFTFRAVSLNNPAKVSYRYRLLHSDTIWSPARNENQVTYSGLNPGEYIFEVLARNEIGVWNTIPTRYPFIIKPPFYRTWWFILGMAMLTLLLIFAYIKMRERKLILEKHELEEKVNERTIEIRRQKSEIEEKNLYLEEAYDQISEQKALIEQKNTDITASIEYAKRIQTAMLPSGKVLQESLEDHFIIFKPKDIVSGDFYWTRQKGDSLVLVAADCTGHGVPGAFMSMLGISFLDEIVDKENETDPGRILNKLRDSIIVSLKQKGQGSDSKDGMDMAVCYINLNTGEMHFAGANNPLYLISNGSLEEIGADRMPVAIHERMEPFTSHRRTLQPGTQLYLFSDGFADQFGGAEGRKFKYRPFRELLLSVSGKPMCEQKLDIEKCFRDWIAGPDPSGKPYEQVDDIVILGCRMK